MKRIILALAVIIGLSLAVKAEQASHVMFVLQYAQTCRGASVSNATPYNVVGSTFTATYSIVINNEDATANLYCNDLPNVTIAGANRGFKITPGSVAGWLLPGFQNWYCISDGGAPTNAMICRGH